MKRSRYCIIMMIDDVQIGTMILKAKDDNQAYFKALKRLMKNQICITSSVRFEFEII